MRLLQRRPLAYQTFDRERREVRAGYRIDDEGVVRFEPAAHDPARALVIDLVLTYATYLGGTLGERIGDITVDAGGNVVGVAPLIGTLELDLLSSIRFSGAPL